MKARKGEKLFHLVFCLFGFFKRTVNWRPWLLAFDRHWVKFKNFIHTILFSHCHMQKKEVRKLFSLPSVHWSLVLTCARTQFEIPDHISSSPKLHLLNLNNGSHLFILPAILYFSQPPTRSQLPRSSIVLD